MTGPCRERSDEEFHTAVWGVTSCQLLFKQSVTAAGLWAAGSSVPCSTACMFHLFDPPARD